MFETDEDLSRAIKDLATQLVPDRPPPADVHRRVRRRRQIQAAGSVGALAAVVTVLAIALAALLPLGGGPTSQKIGPASEPPSPPAFGIHDASGVQVTLPSTWTFDSGTGISMIEPAILFVAGSWNFPTHGDCAPNAAIDSLPSDGVLLWLVEYTSPNTPVSAPPRPEQMDLGPLVGPIECVGTSAHVIGFKDAGRVFQMYVVMGSDANDSVRQEAVNALNSILVAPAPAPGTRGQ